MALFDKIFFFLFFIISASKLAFCEDEDFLEDRLINDIFEKYNSNGRPVKNYKDSVDIKFGVTLVQVQNIDEKNNVADVLVWIEQEWIDEKIKWNPSEYDGVNSIKAPDYRLWMPDLALYNSADAKITSLNYACNSVNAILFSNGKVLEVPVCGFKTFFKQSDDTIIIKLIFGSWTHSANEISLNVADSSGGLDLTYYEKNPDWTLEKTEVKKESQIYPCCPEAYDTIEILIELKRRNKFD